MIKIDVYELPETSDGEFKHHVEYREYPEEGKRHSNLCVVCGFPSYPKCREWCQHQGYDRDES
jgi:hypothetical protein